MEALIFLHHNLSAHPLCSLPHGTASQAEPRALPSGVRKVPFTEIDKVQTTLVLKLQFLIQFKLPLFPQLRPEPGSVTCSWENGVHFFALRVLPPLALTVLRLRQEGGKEGKGPNGLVDEVVRQSLHGRCPNPGSVPQGHSSAFFQTLPPHPWDL